MDSLASHASIRVLVVPFGQISVARFKRYFACVSKLNELSLQQVTPPADLAGGDSAFEFQDWKDGLLRFNFVVRGAEHDHEHPTSPALGDDEDHTLSRLGWHSLQVHRRCVAVLGICDCPSTPNLDEAFAQFAELVKRYPRMTVARWCAFDLTEDQMQDQDMMATLLETGMEVIQPERFTDGISSYDFQMERVVCNLGTTLLAQFDSIVKEGREKVAQLGDKSSASEKGKLMSRMRSRADSYISMLMNGATYPGDRAIAARLSDAKDKKRKMGRLQAWMGGYCLLAGSPQDALNLYNKAILNASAIGDVAWQAVALEGSASALYLLRTGENSKAVAERMRLNLTRNSQSGSSSSSAPTGNVELTASNTVIRHQATNSPPVTSDSQPVVMIGDVRAALYKAARLYSQLDGFWPLQAKATLTLACYLAITRPPLKDEAVKVLSDLVGVAYQHLSKARNTVPSTFHAPIGFTPDAAREARQAAMERQVREAEVLFRNICIKSAVVFESFHFPRKASFFLQQASLHESNWGDSFSLLQLAGERLSIHARYTEAPPVATPSTGRIREGQPAKAWLVTRKQMLETLVDAAQNAGKSRLAIDYCLQLLEMEGQAVEEQQELKDIIESCVSSGGFTYLNRACCFPSLRGMEVLDHPAHLALHKRKIALEGKDSPGGNAKPFFYSPFERNSKVSSMDASRDGAWAPSLRWVQSEIIGVVVELANPMAFAARVSSISLDIREYKEGATHEQTNMATISAIEEAVECHRSSFVLRPGETLHRVKLSARPLACGRYVLHGCVVASHGLISRHPAPAGPVMVEVLPSMPALAIEHSLAPPVSEFGSGAPLILFDGEQVTLECVLHQSAAVLADVCEASATVAFEPVGSADRGGGQPAHTAKVSSVEGLIQQVEEIAAQSDRSSTDEEPVSDYLITSNSAFRTQRAKVETVFSGLDSMNARLREELQRNAASGTEVVAVPLHLQFGLRARRGCHNATLAMAYTAGDSPMERRTKLGFDLQVQRSIQVVFLDVVHGSVGQTNPQGGSGTGLLLLVHVLNQAEQTLSVYATPRSDKADGAGLEPWNGCESARADVRPGSIRRLALPITKHDRILATDLVAWVDRHVRLVWCTTRSGSERRGEIGFAGARSPTAALERLNSASVAIEVTSDRLEQSRTQPPAWRVKLRIFNSAQEDVLRRLSVELSACASPFKNELAWSGLLSLEVDELGPGKSFEHEVVFRLLADRESIAVVPLVQRKLELVLFAMTPGASQRTWSANHTVMLEV